MPTLSRVPRPDSTTPLDRRALALPRLAAAAIASLLVCAGPAAAVCPDPSILAGLWCTAGGDIPFVWGQGLSGACPINTPEGSECQQWRAAVRAAVDEFNAAAVLEFDTPLFLQEAGDFDPGSTTASIVFQLADLGEGDCSSEGIQNATTLHRLDTDATSSLLPFLGAGVAFNRQMPWGPGGLDRTTVARHELMHALGAGHAAGSCLMSPSLACGETHDIDESALAPLRCLYGDLFGSGCSNPYGIMVSAFDADDFTFQVGQCGCAGSGCAGATGGAAKGLLAPTALSYEFAISESGSAYSVFAVLQESDLVQHRYTHHFTQSYQSAMVRLRVLDGASVVDEAFLLYPVTIQATSTAAPAAVATQSPLRLRSAPNPFAGQTTVSFALLTAQSVQVEIYDAAGRHVATLQDGALDPGEHSLSWNGRLPDGTPAASGIYRCVVRAGGTTAARALLKLR